MAGSTRDPPVCIPQSGLLWGAWQDVPILLMGVGWDHRLVLYQPRRQICSPWPLIPQSHWIFTVQPLQVRDHVNSCQQIISATMCLEFFSPSLPRTQLKLLTASLISWKPFKTFELSSTTTNGFKIIQTMREEGRPKSEQKYTKKQRNKSLKNLNNPPPRDAWI